MVCEGAAAARLLYDQGQFSEAKDAVRYRDYSGAFDCFDKGAVAGRACHSVRAAPFEGHWVGRSLRLSQQAVWRTAQRLGRDASPYPYAKTVRRARSDAAYHLCLVELSSYEISPSIRFDKAHQSSRFPHQFRWAAREEKGTMRKLISMMLLGAVVLSGGCIRSLHPIYTDKDLVFEPSLIGEWGEDNSEETWAFSKVSTNEYELVYTDGMGKQGTFSAHLVKIKEKFFLDFFPAAAELKENDFYQFHLLRVHTFAYVRQIEPTLQMTFPDADWLKKFLEDNPDSIQHEKIEDEVILTAATTELQNFWLKHTETKGAFWNLSNFQRKTSTHSKQQPNKSAEGDGLKPAP